MDVYVSHRAGVRIELTSPEVDASEPLAIIGGVAPLATAYWRWDTVAKDQHVTRLVIRCPTANPIQHFPISSERDSALAPVTAITQKFRQRPSWPRQKEQHMTDIMIRVEAEDYDAWPKTHYDHVEHRHSYGMTDGPVYRDIDNSNAPQRGPGAQNFRAGFFKHIRPDTSRRTDGPRACACYL